MMKIFIDELLDSTRSQECTRIYLLNAHHLSMHEGYHYISFSQHQHFHVQCIP